MPPTSPEIAAIPDLAEVCRIIDQWLLIEYAVTFLPMNQSAPVEAVSKSAINPAVLAQLGVELPPPPLAVLPMRLLGTCRSRRIARFTRPSSAASRISISNGVRKRR